MVATVKQLCAPNETVFDDNLLDRVERLQDFVEEKIDPHAFFGKNYMTDGLSMLIDQGFERLSGRSQNAVFYLTQAMGGGKTHSIIAFGLLAKDKNLRAALIPERAGDWDFGDAVVIAVNGRENYDNYLWGYIAEHLGKADQFADFFKLQPKAPAPSDWQKLLGDDEVVIMFDELPTYLQAVRSTTVGNSDLADITGRALANLLEAVSSLPRACVVVTDLSNTYREGSKVINDAIKNFEGEANRQAVPISPVRLNSDEIFHILRKRIFSKVPLEGDDSIEEVAAAYVEALKKAKAMDVIVGTPEQIADKIRASYPFHPSIRDICARFRENSGYQQTRDLISLMRLITRAVWGRQKDDVFLIGLQHIDLNDAKTASAVKRINGTLDNAIAKDVAAKGNARAELVDDAVGDEAAVQAANLLLMSSLSTAMDPVVGLSEPELTEYLVAPLQNAAKFREAVDKLRAGSWYLHKTREGKFYFSNVENVVAKLNSYAVGYLPEVVTKSLRTKLEEMFRPTQADCYQRVLALPAPDQIQPEQDKVTLVIIEPHGKGLNPEAQSFYDGQTFKNRILFLTGDAFSLTDLDKAARELKAVEDILKEFERRREPEGSAQMEEARELETETLNAFNNQVRETFKTVFYPTSTGLRTVAVTMQFTANKYDGEEQIRKALAEKKKFYPDIDTNLEMIRLRAEEALFNAKTLPWADILRSAAMDSSWIWMSPKGLDHVKGECIGRKYWREHPGGYIEKPPFEKDKTSVNIKLLNRDEETGLCRWEATPVYGDRVHWATSASVSELSPIVDKHVVETDAATVWFLCTDSNGVHETGEAKQRNNEVIVKIAVKDVSTARQVSLRAVPGGLVRYTMDHSDPVSSGTLYSTPFEVGDDGCYIRAVAELDGVRSVLLEHNIPARGGNAPVLDVGRAAKWKVNLKRDTTEATYVLVKAGKETKANFLGVTITATDPSDSGAFVRTQFGEKLKLSFDQLEASLAEIRKLCPSGELEFSSKVLSFETGHDLQKFADEIGVQPKPEDVTQ